MELSKEEFLTAIKDIPKNNPSYVGTTYGAVNLEDIIAASEMLGKMPASYNDLLKANEELIQRIDKAIKFIEKVYYSKNTVDIDSIVVSNDKLIQVRQILIGGKNV